MVHSNRPRFPKKLHTFGATSLLALFILGSTAVLLSSCAANTYVVHPGSINTFDSVTADVLLQAKTLLDHTRTMVNGKTTGAWAALAKAYDTANASYKVWRQFALATPTTPPDNTTLKKQLADLSTSIKNWNTVSGGLK